MPSKALVAAIAFLMLGVGLLAVPEATSAVPPESQTWFLTDISAGPAYVMNKGSGAGGANVIIGDPGPPGVALWVANEAATTNVAFGVASWTFTVAFTTGSSGFTVQLGQATSGGDWTPATDAVIVTGSGNPPVQVTLTPSSDFTVLSGNYLALSIDDVVDSTNTVIVVKPPAPGNSPSYLESPSSDPGYPVPELSTLILCSSGILLLGAAVLWRRKK